MIVLFKALQVILALVILVLVHELGHFTFAKLFGIRVDKFYIFFDVKGKALCRFKRGETEYGIGILPLGGYCKIAGMVDESMDLEHLHSEPQSWEFRSHPAWQRLLVMAGGVLFNFILAIIVNSAIAGIWGSAYIDNSASQIQPSELASQMGFRLGDRVLNLDGKPVQNFASIQADILRKEVRKVQVLRDADTVNIYIDHALTEQMLSDQMFGLALPFIVDSVMLGSGNEGALSRGDRILSIEGQSAEYLHTASNVLAQYKDRSVEAMVMNGCVVREQIVHVDSLGKIGVFINPPAIVSEHYNPLQSIAKGFSMTFGAIGSYLQDLKMVAKPSTGAYKSVGSFISIGQIFPSAWDWGQFLSILAMLSIMLGIMNLLPIPGLDGGHIVITLFEIITGKKPSERFLVITQYIGMMLLFMLMFLAFGNDISRLF